MWCWENRVAVITDCEDEVGFAIIEKLAKSGMTVVSFGKTDLILEKVRERLKSSASNKIILYHCDITNIAHLEEMFAKIKEKYEGIDVLINNAYCNMDCLVTNGALDSFRQIIDMNIYALIACVRLAAGQMIERKTRGHIININDISSYQISGESHKSVFIASKAAVTSVNEILRHEFRYLKANIKVTNIACGRIESAERESNQSKLKIQDVAKLIKLILATPEHLQLHEVLLDSFDE